MRVVLGHSDQIETVEAVDEAIATCEAALDGVEPKAVLVTASVEYDLQRMLGRIRERWPEVEIAGCTSDGDMSASQGHLEDAVLLIAFAGDSFRAKAVVARDLDSGDNTAIREGIAASGIEKPKLALVYSSMSSNCSEVTRVVQAAAGPGCLVVGGVSADHHEYEHCREFVGTEVLQSSAAILLFEGDFHVSSGVESGWFPIGDALKVTASAGKVVHEIGGRAATSIYADHWGDVSAASLIEFPLAVYEDASVDDFYMRAALGRVEDGSLEFAGNVPENAVVRVTEVMPDGILAGSTASIDKALASYPGEAPAFVLIIACAARKWVLGTQAAGECDALTKGLSKHGLEHVPFAGAYFFGEIAPTPHCDGSVFHNETCVSVVIGN